jgi:hypothetical protein
MDLDAPPGRFEAIMRTLEVFDDITTYGAGTVLYSRRWNSTPLPRNLQAAMAATGLGIKSLDHTRRTYIPDDTQIESEPAVDAYIAAYLAARDYMRETRSALHTTERSRDHMGTFAASIALQRLESGFRAAHLLYRLGLNVEGDAVSRQILEQIAWALVAAGKDDLEAIDGVSATKAVNDVKRQLPGLGRLYGLLNNTTHAGLAEHRRLVTLGPDEQPQISMARQRLVESAEILLERADGWVVICEQTQVGQLDSVRATTSINDPTPKPDREFLGRWAELVRAIRSAEEATA